MAEGLYEISIAAAPSQVFQALSATDGIRGWWADDGVYDGKLAGKARVNLGSPQKALVMETMIFCKDEEILWRCLNGPPGWDGSNISWLLEPEGDDHTKVSLEHSGWRTGEAERKACDGTWRELLASLKRFVETGTPDALFKNS